jgi:hypothetical protein
VPQGATSTPCGIRDNGRWVRLRLFRLTSRQGFGKLLFHVVEHRADLVERISIVLNHLRWHERKLVCLEDTLVALVRRGNKRDEVVLVKAGSGLSPSFELFAGLVGLFLSRLLRPRN